MGNERADSANKIPNVWGCRFLAFQEPQHKVKLVNRVANTKLMRTDLLVSKSMLGVVS